MNTIELPDGFVPDVVVLGAGLVGGVLTSELLALDPGISVLVLDSGGWSAPDHGQAAGAGLSFLDSLSAEPWQARGSLTPLAAVEAIGGASLGWSAWSPPPRPAELRHWPRGLARELVGDLLPAGRDRLGVSDRHSRSPLATELAGRIVDAAAGGLLPGAAAGLARTGLRAPIALSPAGHAFSPVPSLAGLARDQEKRLQIRPGHRVVSVEVCDGAVAAVVTSRGRLELAHGTRVVLAMNTVESTRQVLLAVPDHPRAGQRLAAHVLSEVSLRVPLSRAREAFEWGALLVPGRLDERSLHVQIHAGAGPVPEPPAESLRRRIPGLSGAELLAGADATHAVVNLAALGELPAEGATRSGVRLSRSRFDAFGIPLPIVDFRADALADPVWNLMDDLVDDLAAAIGGARARYRGPADPPGEWRRTPPPRRGVREGGRRWGRCAHMSGTLWLGADDGTAVTDECGRVYGVAGLFAAGLALFPRAGSHNGGLTAVALALKLARELVGQR